MKIDFEFTPVRLKKLYPLRISRGEITENHNLFVFGRRNGFVGIGEMAPGGGTESTTPEGGIAQLQEFLLTLKGDEAIAIIWSKAREFGMSPAVLAALDIALWDLHAKELGAPLYRCLGLSPKLIPTSLTIGINPPEIVRERAKEVLARTGASILKIKLGSTEGIDADMASFSALYEALTPHNKIALRVDANGGWSLSDAKKMLKWLAARGVEFAEQPLQRGEEESLPSLFRERPMPIYVDESCHFSQDIPKVANCVDGIVVKLMKCGGISEALRLVATARAHNLKTMIGCMGESSVAISAGASIGSLFDYIDLDSFINLNPDPTTGVKMVDGTLMIPEIPGHGASFRDGL